MNVTYITEKKKTKYTMYIFYPVLCLTKYSEPILLENCWFFFR